MTRNRFFLGFAAVALGTALLSGPASAARVQIQILDPDGGSLQTLILTVPQDCARTQWPEYVVSCEDLDLEAMPGGEVPTFVVSPRGRLIGIKFEAIDSDIDVVNDADGHVRGVGHPRDRVRQLGSGFDGGADIWLQSDEDSGEAKAAYMVFTDDDAFRQWKTGDEDVAGDQADRPTTWGSIKALHD